MDEKKVVALLDEEDVAALMYHYVSEVREVASPDSAAHWDEEKDAETRRLIKKCAYLAGLLDDIDKQKAQPVEKKPTVAAITRTVSGA